ncbi:hypothetical protein J3E73DRAFT_407073 [Bipolaris maydis]|nr:hypothetical protein J3E73DRAFT_407073 [Bipolaris maydis]
MARKGAGVHAQRVTAVKRGQPWQTCRDGTWGGNAAANVAETRAAMWATGIVSRGGRNEAGTRQERCRSEAGTVQERGRNGAGARQERGRSRAGTGQRSEMNCSPAGVSRETTVPSWRVSGALGLLHNAAALLMAVAASRPYLRIRPGCLDAWMPRHLDALPPTDASLCLSCAALLPSLARSIHPLRAWPSICPGPRLPRIPCVPAYLSLALLLNHTPISTAYKSKQVEDGHSGICPSGADEGRREGPCLASGRRLPTGCAAHAEHVPWPILYTPHASPPSPLLLPLAVACSCLSWLPALVLILKVLPPASLASTTSAASTASTASIAPCASCASVSCSYHRHVAPHPVPHSQHRLLQPPARHHPADTLPGCRSGVPPQTQLHGTVAWPARP